MEIEDYFSVDNLSNSDDFEVVHSHEAKLPQAELDKILEWLEPTKYEGDSSEFSHHLRSRAPGTGKWVCETDRFQQWQASSRHGSLWVKGPPGAGKSVVAASTIQHLRETEGTDTPVLFFFFRHIILANRHPRGLVRDWLSQLLPYSVALQGRLQPMTKSRLGDVSSNHLWECLLKGLSNVPRAFCVVDAMDEMDTGSDEAIPFFHQLNRLATFRPATVKVFMTSRPRQDLQSCLSAASIVYIDLEEDRVGKEIEIFVSRRLEQDASHGPPAPGLGTLAKDIAARSRGLFLYARLLVDQLLPGLGSGAEIDIASLPVHLEDMYNQMLARQAKEAEVDTEVQVLLLGSITHATRPLRLRELAGLLDYKLRTGPLETSKQIARSACHPLVQILDDETVQIIHHSFSEFLLDARRQTSPDTSTPQFPTLDPTQIHKELAITCLGVNTLAIRHVEEESEPPEVSLPFSAYARESWSHHLSYLPYSADDNLVTAIEAFSRTARASKACWRHLPDCSRNQFDTPLHVASATGMVEYVRRLLSRYPMPPQPFDDGQTMTDWSATPLGTAYAQGRVGVMDLLWPTDYADPIHPDLGAEMFASALRRANAAVVEFLLKRGLRPPPNLASASPYTQADYKETSEDCLRLLLPHLADDQNWLAELLCSFAARGWDKHLQVVLSGTQANATWADKNGSALYQACAARGKSAGHVECVNALLPSFHDIDRRETVKALAPASDLDWDDLFEDDPHPQKDRTVLHALAGSWDDEDHDHSSQIFDLLLGAGLDLEARDALGDTPVLCLFPTTYPRSVVRPLERMLESGADVGVRDNNGASLMHRAVTHHLDIRLLELLVAHGADVNALWQRYPERPPVHVLNLIFEPWDLFGTKSERVRLNPPGQLAEFLIRKGATIEAGDPSRMLSRALDRCDIGVFRLLLKTLPGDSRIDQCIFYILPSWEDSGRKRDDPLPFIQALVAAGVSLETRADSEEHGSSALLEAVSNKAVFDAFVRAGADKNATDSQGRGALHYLLSPETWAGRDGPGVERLRELADMGFDPRGTDARGNSLLHITLPLYQHRRTAGSRDSWLFPILEQLIEYGLSFRTTNNAGWTPLHSYFEAGVNRPSWRLEEPEQHMRHIMEFLAGTKEGVDLNARDEEGIAPLHLAAMKTWDHALSCVRILRDAGADLTAVANDGRNALHLAARARNTTVVGFLASEAPELLSQKDKQGRTPLFDACISGVVESVGSLLRAGADASLHDNSSWTPLHACSEFAEEQRRWDAAEVDGKVVHLDRYRPRSRDDSSFSERRDGGVGQSPGLVLNQELAMLAVADALLAAGGDAVAKGGERGVTPAQRAAELDCNGVLLALKEHGQVSAGAAVSSLSSRLEGMGEERVQDVLRNPWGSISTYSAADITWLKEHDANFHVTIRLDSPNSSDNSASFRRIYSFVELVALTGLTSAMALLGDAAQHYEDPSTPLDRWTLELIAKHSQCSIGPDDGHGSWSRDDLWDPTTVKTVGKFYRPTQWVVHPLLRVACHRTRPNMEMLRTLVERCHVDVNAPSTDYFNGYRNNTSVDFASTLPYLATEQQFWHLEAIRYLVSQGADIHGKDAKGMTALHHACASDGPWTYRFVRLLLELGADPFRRDSAAVGDGGRTSIDVTQSAEALRALADHGVDLGKRSGLDLWLGIGRRKIHLVRMALDCGADVNAGDDAPSYIVDSAELDRWLHISPLYYYDPAVPLYAALLYVDYLQEDFLESGEDTRAAIIRLLIERGADMFPRLRRFFEDQETWETWTETTKDVLLHNVFQHVRCPKVYLEIFFEYADRIDFNALDGHGQTVFLAACDARLDWFDNRAFRLEEHADAEGVIDEVSEAEWDATGLFLRMLDHGADCAALDQNGDNALHILLANPFTAEEHILAFLARPDSHPLIHTKNHQGFTPVQLALRILRPRTVEALLALGAGSLTDPPDPDGFGPLHRIAEQCLLRHVPARRALTWRQRLTPQRGDFAAACRRLWAAGLAAGLDVDAPDTTARANPPLFHYLAHHAANLDRPRFWRDPAFPRDDACHLRAFDGFFGAADLRARNAAGETALHVVARHAALDGTRYYEPDHRLCRGGAHDANVFRFLVVERGLDPLLVDNKGLSSLDVAAADNRVTILEVFKQKN